MTKILETVEDFAQHVVDMLGSDRDVNVGIGGFTGEGKSTFATKLAAAYAAKSGTSWNFDRMTWSRKELLTWVDGEKNTQPGPDGLKPGQLPEYSVIIPDELFLMFYRRNWYEDDQIGAIGTFNMCRDRHLLVIGNVPDFWDLDPGFIKRIRYYVYIPARGTAWVFQQENNPFANDPWNRPENKKMFRKKKNPYSCPNFVCEISFNDWDPKEKKQYYKIRNEKRLQAVDENKSEKKERYGKVKAQRDNTFQYLFGYNEKVVACLKSLNCQNCIQEFKKRDLDKAFTNRAIAEVSGMGEETIRMIRLGIK